MRRGLVNFLFTMTGEKGKSRCPNKRPMFANGPGDQVSISGRVIPKTQKMVLNATLLNTQHYKVRVK